MTVVVHSFVADSSLLDLWFSVCVCVGGGGGGGGVRGGSFPTLCLQVGNHLGFF